MSAAETADRELHADVTTGLNAQMHAHASSSSLCLPWLTSQTKLTSGYPLSAGKFLHYPIRSHSAILTLNRLTNEDDGVQCMHGQTECLGNIISLCAAREYPDPKLHLGFTNCMINDYPEIPKRQLIEDCALEHGLDFDVLNDCMSKDTGAYGMGLLRDSVKHSQDVGAGISCTVRLDDKVRCVRDGGQWKDCEDGHKPEDLIADIERLYDEAQGWTLA